MVALALGIEVLGAILLLVGLGVRWIAIPLLVTMIVAAFSAHWHNGWQELKDRQRGIFNAKTQRYKDTESTGKSLRLCIFAVRPKKRNACLRPTLSKTTEVSEYMKPFTEKFIFPP